MLKPTDIHPGLQEERLIEIANLIRAARHEAEIRHEPRFGDDNWVLGCRCYRWSCHAIEMAVETSPDWLRIVEGGRGGLHFVFSVGTVPLRFYRGEPADVPAKTLRINFPELHAHQDAFAFAKNYTTATKTHLRLAVETDEVGEATVISLVEVDEDLNRVGDPWVIPGETGKVFQFRPKDEGKDLGKPTVGSRKRDENEDEGEE